MFTRLLPANLQVFAIGFISSMGSSGGAVVPFLTGLVAQAAGTWVLHPICEFIEATSTAKTLMAYARADRYRILRLDDHLLGMLTQTQQASRVA